MRKIEEKKFTTKRKVFLLGSLSFVTVVSIMIFTAIGASLWGAELHSLEQEIAKIEEENRTITTEIVTNSSLTELYAGAEGLGFVKPANIVYLNRDTSVAQTH